MKIAIIRPRYRSFLIAPPLGMGVLSSYLKSKGHTTKIIDGLNLDLPNDEIVDMCLDEGAELVGVYCLSAFFLDAKDLINKLKAKGIKVMVGGMQSTFMPQYTLENTMADFVIVGEAEETVDELAKSLANGKPVDNIQGVYTSSTKSFTERQVIEDLDSIPFADWEQIDPRTYKKAPHGGFIKNFPYAPISATRGCPYRCTFCASPAFSKRRIRFRSPENVVNEIKYLIKNFGVKEIHFEDDNLTLKRDFMVSICNLLIQEKIRITWACPNGVRADKVDYGLTSLMRKSGCYYLAFGIESGSQQILDNVKKDITLEKIEEGVKAAAKAGIMTQGFFIFGLPGETEETIEETIKFAKKLPLTRAQFLNLDVMPGTEIFETLKYEEKRDWTKQSYHDVTWVPNTVSEEVLKEAPARALKEFYFRPKQLLSMIRYVRPTQLTILLKRLRFAGIV
ncbi:radical SAM protein [Candidatus Woesearchaeota archaeon]|nr:radical SAM protein [Candidatus Woesearchaeota archaeon]